MMNTCYSFGCILLILGILGGCGSTDKPAPICAGISVNPNTPMGSQIGPGGTWDPKGQAQTVLAFTLFRIDGEGCQTATVTGLPMKIDPNTSQFVIGRNFRLVSELGGRLVDISVGTVMSDGKLNVKLPTGGNLEKDERRYFQLHLDTSNAQRGDKLAITSGAVEYEVSEKKFTSYQLRYTPPPIEY